MPDSDDTTIYRFHVLQTSFENLDGGNTGDAMTNAENELNNLYGDGWDVLQILPIRGSGNIAPFSLALTKRRG